MSKPVNHLIYFLKYLKRYGLRGVFISIKLSFNQINTIKLPKLNSYVQLRKNSTDIAVFHQIFAHDHYKFELDFSPETVIDLGANIGLASLFFANEYTNPTIIAVEPELNNFNQLLKNTAAHPNIITVQKAISNVSNQLVSIVDNGLGEWGFTTSSTQTSDSNLIQTITIDDLISEFNISVIDVLKIDIEGAERELFENNYHAWLAKTKCLIIELHDHLSVGASSTFFSAISQYNFSLFLKGENLVFINNDLGSRQLKRISTD